MKLNNQFREYEIPLAIISGIKRMAAAKEWVKTGAGVKMPKKITYRDIKK